MGCLRYFTAKRMKKVENNGGAGVLDEKYIIRFI